MKIKPSLKIGYAQQTITPTLDRTVYLAGFGHNRVAQTIHDDLTIRALALIHGETRLVIAALDLIGLSRFRCQEIEAQINHHNPGTRLILASTHTHHGPDTLGLWGLNPIHSGVDSVYIQTLQTTVIETLTQALRDPQPAALKSAAVHVPGVAKNARDPDIVDDELTCLQFCAPDDAQPLVTFLIFPCHPEVLWEHNPHITSDYPGYLRDAVQTATNAPCLFTVGAIGGMMTPNVKEHTFDAAEHMGQTLADAALETLNATEPHPVQNLSYAVATYNVPLMNPLFKAARATRVLPKNIVERGIIPTEANLLRIGNTWLATGPGEIFPKLGLSIKDQLKQAGASVAGLIGLANDELGYILPQQDFDYPLNPFNPGDHYEETMSVGPDAGPSLMAAIKRLLNQTQ